MIKTLLETFQMDLINSYCSLIPAWIVIKKAKSTLVTSIVPPKAGIAESTKSPSYNSISYFLSLSYQFL